jgi:histone H3/H4
MLRSPAAAPPEGAGANEILIVASRLKEYISARSGFSTSDKVLTPLSSIVRRVCNQAIENTRRAGRQTVLDRDIPE